MLETLKVLGALAVILALLRKRLNLGLAMLVGALCLGAMFGATPALMGRVGLKSVTSVSTVNVLMTMLLVIGLEDLMEHSGMMDKVISSIGVLVRDRRLNMAILPAFLGLLPSAGGALLSCPMVENAAGAMEMSPERKAVTNFWYRHVMESAVPVYPGMFLASEILGISLRDVVLALIPLSVVSSLAVIPVVFGGLPRAAAIRPANPSDNRTLALKSLLVSVSPVLIVVLLVVGLGLRSSVALAPVTLGLLAILRPGWRYGAVLFRRIVSPRYIMMVVGIMFFKDILTETSAVQAIADLLVSTGAPTLVLLIAIPFMVGFLTGISSAVIAISFPVLSTIIAAQGAADPQLMAISYAAGIFGQCITPMHLCLVLTAEYFKADLVKMIRMHLIPGALVTGFAVLLNYLF